MAFEAKTYIVQKGVDGEVIGVKLTRQAAHDLAKANAPARVIFGIADKDAKRNVVYDGVQNPRRA